MKKRPDLEKMKELVETIAKLRDPDGGCPWDLEQTHKSLLPYLIEEAYEYLYAVEAGSTEEMVEELGDILLQVILHSQIAKDNKLFDLSNVCEVVNKKLIQRHPHVFANPNIKLSKEQISKNWKEIKAKENKEIFPESLLKNPALYSSYKIGKRSKDVDFDWDNSEEVWTKVAEEFEEVKQAKQSNNKQHIKEELGDLFFTLSQYCRHLGENPEEVAREANIKFLGRMKSCEKILKKNGQVFSDLGRGDKENLWVRVKENEQQ